MKRLAPAAVAFTAVAILDQLTKAWALRALWDPPRELRPLPGWLHLTPVENRGVAFGLFEGQAPLLLALVLAILAILAFRGWRDFMAAPVYLRVLVGAVAGGAVGNLVDRFRLGWVADFVTLPKLPFFQVFNLADSVITIGGTVLVLILWRRDASR